MLHNPHLQARMLIETGALSKDQFTFVGSHHTHPQRCSFFRAGRCEMFRMWRRNSRTICLQDRIHSGYFGTVLLINTLQPRHSPRKTRMAACSGNLGLLLCFLQKIWAEMTTFSKGCKRSSADLLNSGGKELFTIEGGPMSLGRDVFPHRSWEVAGSCRKHVASTKVNDCGVSIKIGCPKM